jgi:hypothetical protein
MLLNQTRGVICIAAAAILVACAVQQTVQTAPPESADPPGEVWTESASTPSELDGKSTASFVIMSDHKGYGPQDSDNFAHMVQWSREMGSAFTVGMGDHLKVGWTNLIMRFMDEDTVWRDTFYPNIADGENEYYGTAQSDWGAGGRLLDDVGLPDRPNVQMRSNGAEYYATLRLADYTVHLIQLHFPDQPADPAVAFRETSREWLDSLLQHLPSEPTDIVVVGAHSKMGYWVEVLNTERRRRLLSRADIVMSATTHRFQHFDFGEDSALVFNTGTVNFGAWRSDVERDGGYLTVHLLPNPDRLIVQYVGLNDDQQRLAPYGKAYVRLLDNRRTLPVSFVESGMRAKQDEVDSIRH